MPFAVKLTEWYTYICILSSLSRLLEYAGVHSYWASFIMPTGKLTGKRKAVEPAPTYWDECKVKYENPTNARDENLEAEAIKGELASQKAKDAGHSFGNLSSEMKKLSGRCGMSRFVSDATNLLCPYHSCARV